MTTGKLRLLVLAICAGAILFCASPAAAGDEDLVGKWNGIATFPALSGYSSQLRLQVFEYAPGVLGAVATFPDLVIFDTTVYAGRSGNTVAFGDPSPGGLLFVGTLSGTTITGTSTIPYAYDPYYLTANWTLWKDTGEGDLPGPLPTKPCTGLPALFTPGTAAHCAELVSFDPRTSTAWDDYPTNGETANNQYRSWLRRDLRQLVMYATSKVACVTAGWDYGSKEPLGLGDMSEADGAIPGTSVGSPGHPYGSHTDGLDIDLGYYQLYVPDNHLRRIGLHHDTNGVNQYHLTEIPPFLDVWRTALLIACFAEHPRLRVIGVDGKVGPLVEDALDEMVDLGFLDEDLRDSIPLAYEITDMGLGWFRFHHHHLHVSLSPVLDIVSDLDLTPGTLNKKSEGDPVHAFLELDAGYDVKLVDPSKVALILDGHTRLHPDPKHSKVGDHDGDGVPDLKLRFDRQAVLDAVEAGDVELTLTGVVNGTFFRDTVTVTVKENGKSGK